MAEIILTKIHIQPFQGIDKPLGYSTCSRYYISEIFRLIMGQNQGNCIKAQYILTKFSIRPCLGSKNNVRSDYSYFRITTVNEFFDPLETTVFCSFFNLSSPVFQKQEFLPNLIGKMLGLNNAKSKIQICYKTK